MKITILIFLALFNCYAKQWVPKIVWTYWNDPLNESNTLIRAFHKNHLKFTSGWEMRHLDRNNMWTWLDAIPQFRQKLQSNAWKDQGLAKKSDMIRMALINHYGGVYFDKTIILTQHIDWILDVKNKGEFYSDNPQFQEPDTFIHYASHSNGQKFLNRKTLEYTPLTPNLQSFFFAGKPNSKFLTEWLKKAFQQKEISYQKYGKSKFRSFIYDKAIQDQTPISFVDLGNYFQIIVCGGNMIYNRQKQLQKIAVLENFTNKSIKNNLLIQIKKQVIEPRALKYYKLCLMNTMVSGYRYQKYYFFLHNYLFKMDIDKLKEQNSFPPYFVKIWRFPYRTMKFILQSKYSSLIFDRSIVNTSIMNNYILKETNQFKDIDIVDPDRNKTYGYGVYIPIILIITVIIHIFSRNWVFHKKLPYRPIEAHDQYEQTIKL